jgi:2-polyprenyl-3-methyl-5-hydroxy-6-metoxy-1,4-benzoquinol methylase
MAMVAKFADNGDPNSLASRMRSKRNQRFRNAIEGIPRPLNILDVGGAQAVWESIGFVDQPDISITLLNIEPEETSYKNVVSILGDARDMHEFRNGQFDVVYSNSVIEHVGGIEDMRKMAREIHRVGKWYFIQTPNLYFPIEPHFLYFRCSSSYQFRGEFISCGISISAGSDRSQIENARNAK